MKFLSGGSCASIASIQRSSCSVCAAGNATRASCSGRDDPAGVATADPTSSSRLCTSTSSSSMPTPAAAAYSRARPMQPFSSSTSPSAAKHASSFGRRSPLYSDDAPLSPVFV